MENEAITRSEKKLARQAEEYMQAMTQRGEFSGAVLLSRAGRVLHSAGYGLADREHGVANTPHTKFRLGSITKQFTSLAVLVLEEQGKLSVHDPLHEHLPYSPDHWREITIHHLLNHTSGLGNLADIPGCQETTARLPLSVRELVETFRETPLEFRAGSRYRYSNSGYFLLGDIIEHASGVPYETFLQEHIFGPLHMADSGYEHYKAILANRAAGYCKEAGEWVRATYLDMGFPFAAGALYSTVEDLYRWNQALLAGRLISADAHTRMTTITPLLSTYGYGLSMGREHNRRTVEHAGGINGFRANFVRFPDESACVIVLSNSQDSDFVGVTKVLGAILFGEKYEVPPVKKSITLIDTVLASYAGTYQITPGVTLQVEAQEGRLIVTSGQARSRFLPESRTVFFREENGDTITFHLSGDSAVSHLTLHQSGVKTDIRRVERIGA